MTDDILRKIAKELLLTLPKDMSHIERIMVLSSALGTEVAVQSHGFKEVSRRSPASLTDGVFLQLALSIVADHYEQALKVVKDLQAEGRLP